MINKKTFSLEAYNVPSSFIIQYPTILQKDLESKFNSSFNMIADDVVAVRLSDDLFQDGEYFVLFDFFFTFTPNRVVPTLLEDMDSLSLSNFDSEMLLDVDYTIQT